MTMILHSINTTHPNIRFGKFIHPAYGIYTKDVAMILQYTYCEKGYSTNDILQILINEGIKLPTARKYLKDNTARINSLTCPLKYMLGYLKETNTSYTQTDVTRLNIGDIFVSYSGVHGQHPFYVCKDDVDVHYLMGVVSGPSGKEIDMLLAQAHNYYVQHRISY